MFNPDFSDAVTVIDSSTSSNNTIFEVIEYKKPRNGSVFNTAAGSTRPQHNTVGKSFVKSELTLMEEGY